MQAAPWVQVKGVSAFADRCFVDAAGLKLPYRLLLPDVGAPAGPHPLLLVLHGAGERGTENVSQLANGIADVLLENRARFPCFAVIPQCPPGHRWVEVDWSLDSHALPTIPSAPMQAALELLTALEREFASGAAGQGPSLTIDPTRLYVLGLSMGGYGVWDALCRQPGRFAAGVPICGGAPDHDHPSPALCEVPIWAFHGARDAVVPVERSRRIIAALRRQCSPTLARYTEYADVEHNAWTAALAEPDLVPWLFAQRCGPK